MKKFPTAFVSLAVIVVIIGNAPQSSYGGPISSAATAGGKLGVEWNTTDFSLKSERLAPNSVFIWANTVTGELKKEPIGPGGGVAIITDAKTKKGKAALEALLASSLQDPKYGASGEAAIPFLGQITEGAGSFAFSISGLVGVDDVIAAPFKATLVSDGTDNPFDLGLFGQGDQLASPKNSTVSFISKWRSTDQIILSNGDALEIGDFFLNSFGVPTDFSYKLNPDFSGNGTFTIQEDYFFVNNLDDAPTGQNLRQSMTGGTVTKNFDFHVVPEPPMLLLVLAGIGMLLFRRLGTECKRLAVLSLLGFVSTP